MLSINSVLAVLQNLSEKITLDNTSLPVTVSNNVVTFMEDYIITPNVVLSNNLKYMDEKNLRSLIKAELAVFGSIVAESIRVMADVYNLSPRVIIEKIRDVRSASVINAANNLFSGNEEADFITGMFDIEGLVSAGFEAKDNDKKKQTVIDKEDVMKDTGIFVSKYEVKIETKVGDTTKLIVIPLFIQANIIFTDTKALLDGVVEKDVGFFARLDEWRAGAISLAEFLFATDLIKEYKKNRIKNQSDIIKILTEKKSNNMLKLLSGRGRSFSEYYNIFNFDINEKSMIDNIIKGDVIKNSKYKDKLLEALKAFSVSFVDNNKERIFYLTKLSKIPSIVTFKMLGKEKDTDANEIFKNLLSGRPPF